MYEHCARRSVPRACARRRRSTRCIGSTVNIVVRGSSYATCPVLFVHKGLHTLIVRTSLKRRQLRKRVSRDRESVNVFLCLTSFASHTILPSSSPTPMSRYGYAPGLQPEPGFGEYARAASRGPRFGDVSRATLQERLTTPRTNYNTSPPEPLADYRGPVLVNTKDTMCWRQRIVVENLAA